MHALLFMIKGIISFSQNLFHILVILFMKDIFINNYFSKKLCDIKHCIKSLIIT